MENIMARRGINGGHNLPDSQRAWKYCTRCQQNVKDVDNHSKADASGSITVCK